MRYVIGIVVVGVVTIGAIWLISRDNVVVKEEQRIEVRESVGEESEQKKIVRFTDDGYEPSELTVAVGTTVVFVNESNMPMWTASDPHPDHTDHASFDSQEAVNRGGVYEYTFGEVGRYGYHNHSEDEYTGVVIVRD